MRLTREELLGVALSVMGGIHYGYTLAVISVVATDAHGDVQVVREASSSPTDHARRVLGRRVPCPCLCRRLCRWNRRRAPLPSVSSRKFAPELPMLGLVPFWPAVARANGSLR